MENFIFNLDGKEYTLEIYKSILSDNLFIPFKDKTNGKETYEGGRYIDAEILPDYKMILDFNMAYNPSCAYNEKFVCVLPPRENMLDIEIRAGEKNFQIATLSILVSSPALQIPWGRWGQKEEGRAPISACERGNGSGGGYAWFVRGGERARG